MKQLQFINVKLSVLLKKLVYYLAAQVNVVYHIIRKKSSQYLQLA
jgi:NH3-dependent NAD+ synthetase